MQLNYSEAVEYMFEYAPGYDSRWWIVIHPAMEYLLRETCLKWMQENKYIIVPTNPDRIHYRIMWLNHHLLQHEIHFCTDKEMDELLGDDKDWADYKEQRHRKFIDDMTKGW